VTDESDQPSFARFAAAMDAARDARAPQFVLYDETAAAAGAPAVGRVPPWRVLRRPLGIGGGVALAVALLLTLLTPPIGAAIGWLTGPAPAVPGEEAVGAEPLTAVQVAPQPAAAPEEAPPLPRPTLADDVFRAAARQVGSAPEERVSRVTALAAAARPSARSLPVPSLKPSSAAP
jgi:hypothetical protein